MVTLMVTAPDGQTATAEAVVDVIGEVRLAGAFVGFLESDELTFHENEIVMIIDGAAVEFETFAFRWDLVWTQFVLDGEGNEVAVPTDCVRVAQTTLISSDVTFDPGAASFGGTEGTECPFGGGHRDVERVGDVAGTVEDGAATLTIVFPTIPGAYETILNIAAEVS